MGVPPTGDALLTAYARSLIRFKARQLCRKPGFSRSDEPDLQQDLTIALVRAAPKYDVARPASADTFANRVVESAAKMLLRARRRVKRVAGYRASSLEQGSVQVRGKNVPVAETVDADHRQPARSDATTLVETREALQHVISALPPFHAAVARHLWERSEAGVARAMGVSRRQVRAAMQEIRRRFDDAGLGT